MGAMPFIEIIGQTICFVKTKVYRMKLLLQVVGKIVEYYFNIVGETIVKVETHIIEYVIGTKTGQIVAQRHYDWQQ